MIWVVLCVVISLFICVSALAWAMYELIHNAGA